jgi:succinoglycan biosynthesis protein ExoA
MEIQHTPELIAPPTSTTEAPRIVMTSRTQPRGEDVLVVIPTLNEEHHIEACIRSLMQGDGRMVNADIVVVDGGSTDATRAIVTRLQQEFPRLGLMDNPQKLQSAAINRAARLMGAGKSILVRCDAHAAYPPNYAMRVADSLVRNNTASIATPMDATGKSCFQKANAYIVDTPFGSGGSAHRGGRKSKFVDHGHHAGFDMKQFLQLGGYDETFSHNEDGEYDRRLGDAGGKIYLDAEIRIEYTPRATVGALARQYYRYGKGRARNLIKHGDMPKLRQMLPQAALVGSVLGLFLAPLNPWALLMPLTYLFMLAVASVVVAVRMRSLCGLLAGLASGTMHMSWALGFMRQWFAGRKGADPVRSPEATHAE